MRKQVLAVAVVMAMVITLIAGAVPAVMAAESNIGWSADYANQTADWAYYGKDKAGNVVFYHMNEENDSTPDCPWVVTPGEANAYDGVGFKAHMDWADGGSQADPWQSLFVKVTVDLDKYPYLYISKDWGSGDDHWYGIVDDPSAVWKDYDASLSATKGASVSNVADVLGGGVQTFWLKLGGTDGNKDGSDFAYDYIYFGNEKAAPGADTSDEESSTPSEESSTPSEESSTPSEESSTPSEESSTPIEESSTPSEESSTPSEEPEVTLPEGIGWSADYANQDWAYWGKDTTGTVVFYYMDEGNENFQYCPWIVTPGEANAYGGSSLALHMDWSDEGGMADPWQSLFVKVTVDLDKYPYLYISKDWGKGDDHWYGIVDDPSAAWKYYDAGLSNTKGATVSNVAETLGGGVQTFWLKIGGLDTNYNESEFVYDYIYFGNADAAPKADEESSTPDEESSTPNEESSTPDEESSTPNEESSTPNEESSTPDEETSTPDEETSTPDEESSDVENPDTGYAEVYPFFALLIAVSLAAMIVVKKKATA